MHPSDKMIAMKITNRKYLEVILFAFAISGLLRGCSGLRKIPVNITDTLPTLPTLIIHQPTPDVIKLEPIPIGGGPPEESQKVPTDPISAEFSGRGSVYSPPKSQAKIRMCPRQVCGERTLCGNPHTEGFAQCFCDSYCEIFNDCCYNYQACAKFKKLAQKLAPSLRSKEYYFSCSYKVRKVLVSQCPTGSDDYFAHACHSDDDATVYRATPVTVAGIPYKNVYCAQCFGKTLSKTVFWEFEDSRYHVDVANEISWFLNDHHWPLFSFFNPPQGEQFLRSCDPNFIYKRVTDMYIGTRNVISTCAESLKSSIKDFDNLKRKCSLYNADVFSLQGPGELPLRFKNVYCLRCNGLSDENVACPKMFQPFFVDGTRRLGASEEATYVGYGIIPHVSAELDRAPDFSDLFRNPELKEEAPKCPEGTVRDQQSLECRTPRRCDIARTEWQGECIRNPFDQVYANPENGGFDVFTVDMTYTLTSPLVLIVTKDLGTDWSALMLKAVTKTLGVPEKEIVSLNATLRPVNATSRFLLGGKEFNYGAGSKIVTSVFCKKYVHEHIDDLAFSINATAHAALWADVTFNVTNSRVSRPLTCAEGDLVIIDEDVSLVEFLSSWTFPNATGDKLKRLETINEKNQLYYSVCDLHSKKFKGCPLLNYSREEFAETANSSDLVFTSSGDKISQDSYAIVGDTVYVCHREVLLYAHTDSVSAILTIIGLTLSIIFLIYILLTYAMFAKLRTLPGTMLMNLSAILLFAQILFVTSTLPGPIPTFCYVFSVIHHYAWLSTFFWMNAIAINLVRTFTVAMKAMSRSSPRKSLMKFAAYAYGVPALIVTICLVLDLTGAVAIGYARSRSSCWISERDGLLFAFFVPVAAIITVNIGLFIATAVSIVRTKKITKKATEQGASKMDFILYAKISTLIGFTWILGFIGAVTNATAVWYIFIIFNTLSGVFLALAFAFNKRIFKLWRSTVAEVSITTSGTKSTSISGTNTRLTSTSSTAEKGAYARANTTDSEV